MGIYVKKHHNCVRCQEPLMTQGKYCFVCSEIAQTEARKAYDLRKAAKKKAAAA